MDPCPFVHLIVESLSLKLPSTTTSKLTSTTNQTGIHPSTTTCFCKLRLTNLHLPSQTALLPLSTSSSQPEPTTSAPGFYLDAAALRRLRVKPLTLRVSVFAGRMGTTCGISVGKLLGKVEVRVDQLHNAQYKARVFHSGWLKVGAASIGKKGNNAGIGEDSVARVHMVVRAEPDPRFLFQFGGEPECSPVIFQIQENIRQPVFSCKFSADRNSRSRSLPSDFTMTTNNRGWITSFSGEKERAAKERKGWMIIIHDLSGSPVAAASMITPFVPSPGTDRVSRSNPGAWLILRPNGFSVSSWKPWGRLEAWRERGSVDGLGYKFELITDNVINGPNNRIPIAESTMSVKNGGQFSIDSRIINDSLIMMQSPAFKGFVMGSTVEGEGKVSKPSVQVGVQHVTCMADAALFIALSAAIDLSMDACRLFSSKLRKELCHDEHDSLF